MSAGSKIFYRNAKNKSVGIAVSHSINIYQIFDLTTGCLVSTTSRFDFIEYLFSIIPPGSLITADGLYIDSGDSVDIVRTAESTFFGHPYKYYPAIICP